MIKKIVSVLIVIITISLNLYLYRAEATIKGDPNDNTFQYSLVRRTHEIWDLYHCPFSLSCLPNLVDHNVPTWVEGYPLPVYYSHIPQITIVSSYTMVIRPLFSLFGNPLTLFQYYTLTRYILLSVFPLSIFIGLLIAGFNPLIAAFSSFLGTHFSTDGLYGIDPTSFLWRGYGLTSQLYGMMFFPIALGFTYRAMRLKVPLKNKKRLIALSVIFNILTTAGHLGMGIQTLLMSISFLFFDLNVKTIWKRMQTLGVIGVMTVVVLSYWIVPAMLLDKYHMNSFWDPIWKFNSYGWYEVVRQLINGEIFDFGRLPVITPIVLFGIFLSFINPIFIPFGIAFILSLLLYFGRTTWGGLIDLIPGMNGYHLHRFIVSVQMAGLFLIPITIQEIYSFFERHADKLSKKFPKIKISILPILIILVILIPISYKAVQRTIEYNTLNDKWIKESNTAYGYDEKNYNELVSYLKSQKDIGRVYAGRPGNWGKEFRLGSSQLYMLLGVYGVDISQFLPETWSPLSENEQNFDERIPEDYDLLNITHVVSTKNEGFASGVVEDKTFGPFKVFKSPSTGWFDVVTAPMAVRSKKTDFLNIVHLWHRSYPRRWKMHPFITLEKNEQFPRSVTKVITMTDPVNYEEQGIKKNIFSDFPLMFPESTPSGKIVSQDVTGQTYRAVVDVPSPCTSCVVMFKMSYHPSWRLKVDGQTKPIRAVFPFYLAAEVPPGTHTVEFTYMPNTLKTVLLLGTIGSLISLGIFFLLKRYRR